MAMRATTAFTGHMGLELNLLTERESDLAELKQAIALHKRHRALLHDGELFRLDSPPHLMAAGVVAPDKIEALFSLAFLTSEKNILPDRLHFAGLDAALRYRLRLIWPTRWSANKGPSAIEKLGINKDGALFSGEVLMTVGLQLPAAYPETALLFYLVAEA
jgi:alpha-galactosidase